MREVKGIFHSKKCKGIKKNVVKNEITHQDYKDGLFFEKHQYRKMKIIRIINHDIFHYK